VRWLVLFVVLFFPIQAWASAVLLPLEEVAPRAKNVFTAEITSAKETQEPTQIIVTYEIRDIRQLRGTTDAKVVRYREVVIPNAAPLLDGSGIERSTKSGRFIFFANGDDVLRLEPMTQEAKVKALLAKPPPPAATSAPWTPQPVPSASVSPELAPGTNRGCGSCSVAGMLVVAIAIRGQSARRRRA
jgi:hypothetical protein